MMEQAVCLPQMRQHSSMNTINFRRRAAILRKYLMCRIKFITITTCTECGYTELYQGGGSAGWDVLDFLLGG